LGSKHKEDALLLVALSAQRSNDNYYNAIP